MKTFTIPGKQINAMTFGLPFVLVTKGAKDKLDSREMEAVMAHETAHITHLHIPLKLALFYGFQPFCAREQAKAISTEEKNVIVLKWALIRIAAMNVFSYVIEWDADHTAKRRGHGVGLSSALVKIQGESRRPKFGCLMALLQGSYHPNINRRVNHASK